MNAPGTAVRTFLLGLALLGVVFAETSSPGVASRSLSQVGNAVVSMNAAVPPTQENSIAAQLATKEAELSAREAALSGRVPRSDGVSTEKDRTAQYALMMSSILALIVLVHLMYDIRRSHFAIVSPGSVVNLRMR